MCNRTVVVAFKMYVHLKKLNLELSYPGILLLGMYPKELSTETQTNTCTLIVITHNGQKIEAIQVSIKGYMDK